MLVSFATRLRLKPWSIDRARRVMTDVMKRCDLHLPGCHDMVTITVLNEPAAIVDACPALAAAR